MHSQKKKKKKKTICKKSKVYQYISLKFKLQFES